MTQNEDKPEAPDDAGAFDRDAAIQQLKQTQAELREIARRKRETAQARARAEEASNPRQFALNSLMAKHSGQPIDKIKHDTERDNFMSSEEAKAYGLIDEVLITAKQPKIDKK